MNAVFPTAYLAPTSYFASILRTEAEGKGVVFEGQESFEKQTFRNRCTLLGKMGTVLRLTVPVEKVEHKQPTQDIRISYQQNWQHQHWIALMSEYKHTPYFCYYEDFFRCCYEQRFEFLIDLNFYLTDTILHLLRNQYPSSQYEQKHVPLTTGWSGQQWTDQSDWQTEVSILPALFENGPTLNLL